MQGQIRWRWGGAWDFAFLASPQSYVAGPDHTEQQTLDQWFFNLTEH